MSSDILNNLNPGIDDLNPYEPGRSIEEVVAEFGHDEVVKLASNENPLGASPKALSILKSLKMIYIYILMGMEQSLKKRSPIMRMFLLIILL